MQFRGRRSKSGWEKVCQPALSGVVAFAPELVSGVFVECHSLPSCPAVNQTAGICLGVVMDWRSFRKSSFSWLSPGWRQASGWRWPALVSPFAALLIWELICRLSRLPAFILPTPLQVTLRLWRAVRDGSLVFHTAVTLGEVLSGLLLGVGFALLSGYGVARSRLLERFLAPYLVATQAIPVVAIAPLLVIWFGPGMFSKVLICALTVFFPVLVNTVVGIRAVPKPLYEWLASLRATRWQVLRYLEIPAALPVLLGGLRVGATLSVIGAVVGELVGADRGLGFLINVARGQYDTALVFVAVFTLIALALALYGLVSFLERKSLAWQDTASR